jgi:hypothetical protein
LKNEEENNVEEDESVNPVVYEEGPFLRIADHDAYRDQLLEALAIKRRVVMKLLDNPIPRVLINNPCL